MSLEENLQDLKGKAGGLATSVLAAKEAVGALLVASNRAIADAKQRGGDLVADEVTLTTFVLGSGFEVEITAFGAALDTVRSKLELLPERLENLQAQGENLLGSFSSEGEVLADLIEERYQAFEEMLESQHEVVEDEFNEMVDGVERRAKEVLDSIGEFVEDVLTEKPTEALEEVTDTLTNGLEGAAELVNDVASDTIDGTAERVTDLADHVVESVGTSVEESAQELIDLLVERIASEGFEAVAETQVGAQFTMAMQQYLPALIAANAVAGEVQQLLVTARMGS